MLAFVETPEWLDRLYEEQRSIARDMFGELERFGQVERVRREVNLLSSTEHCIAFVRSGIFQYFQSDRMVRLYGEGTWMAFPPVRELNTCRLMSEFAADIVRFDRRTFDEILLEEPSIQVKWFEHELLEHRLMLSLCGLYATENAHPTVTFQHYDAGDRILRQGDPGGSILELLDGTVSVRVDGVETGKVQPGEFLGEISFLTHSHRVASAFAETPCLVQSIATDDFIRLIRSRPQMALVLARTLAVRLTRLNQKVVETIQSQSKVG
jgi:CRP-like cAMP-binding protein